MTTEEVVWELRRLVRGYAQDPATGPATALRLLVELEAERLWLSDAVLGPMRIKKGYRFVQDKRVWVTWWFGLKGNQLLLLAAPEDDQSKKASRWFTVSENWTPTDAADPAPARKKP